MKKPLVYLSLFVLFGLVAIGAGRTFASTQTPAPTHTLSDYGLTPESVKYLTPAEIQTILNSKTPAETIAAKKAAASSATSTTASSSQQFTPPSLLPSGDTGVPPTGTVNCFDYYKFGSVQTNLSLQSSSVVPGMTAQFTGTITNSNNYPIVDGTLYVKIFKIKGTAKDSNGPDVVDQFIALDNITIPANSSIKADFPWVVPLYARGGNYQLASFFTVDKKFNLLGLSFTNDVVGNTFNFIVNNTDSGLYFDNTSVKINGSPFYFAAFPPQISGNDSANVVATVDNTTGSDQTAQITWKLYQWDGIGPDNLIRTISTSTLVKANSYANVNVTISDKDFPVYYLVGELTYKDTKSIADIRFIRAGVDRLRLNFPSILQYPLVKNVSSTMFTCLSNTGTSAVVPDGKVVLQLKDSDGNIINNYTYTGPVTGNMMAVKSDFIAPKNLNTFSIYAEVWQAGKIVDQATISYDCSTLDPTKCTKEESSNRIWLFTLAGIFLLGIIAFGTIIYKKKMNAKILLFVLFFIPLGFLGTPHITNAQTNYTSLQLNAGSVIWTNSESNVLSLFWQETVYNTVGVPSSGILFTASGWNDNGINGGTGGLGQRYESIQYKTEIRNASTNALVSNGSSIPVGTNLILKFLPHVSSDISWFGTGYSDDSPYGEWTTAATPPSAVTCSSKDYVSDATVPGISPYTYAYDPNYNYDVKVYIPLVVSPPTETISGTTNMSCLSLSGNEINGYTMQCTVNAPGSLSPTFQFASTVGQFYYRYYQAALAVFNGGQTTEGVGVGCFGSNIPMAMPVISSFNSYSNNYSQHNTYVLNVPAQNVQYNLTATSVTPINHPPLPPTITIPPNITSPTTGLTNTSYTFNIVSTDQDNDQIQYAISWSNDGVIEQYLPATGLVNSGTSESATKSWATTGTHTFEARAIDSNGALSTWTPFTIVLSDPTPPTPTGLNATTSSVCGSGTINISWNSSAGATSYTLMRDGSSIYTGTLTSYSDTGLVNSSNHSYSVRASNTSGDSVYSGTVSGIAPAVCATALPTVTINQNATITGTSAIMYATISDLGLPLPITAAGIVWSSSNLINPTLSDNILPVPTLSLPSSAPYSFFLSATELGVGAYYYRGFATNTTGTGYSGTGAFCNDPAANNFGTIPSSATCQYTAGSCGLASGATSQQYQPTETFACTSGAQTNSNTNAAWNWSCGTASGCSAPKFGCRITTDPNYQGLPPNFPNNDLGCVGAGATVACDITTYYGCSNGSTSGNRQVYPSTVTWICTDNNSGTSVNCSKPKGPDFQEN